MTIRIYTDGVFDLLHVGHLNLLKQAKEMGDYLIVGVMSDELMMKEKRLPIMTMEERAEALKHCKYVDEIVLNPPDPSEIDDDFLEKYKIDYVVHAFPEKELYKLTTEYAYLISKNKFRQLTRTPSISTTDLIERARKRNLDFPIYNDTNLKNFIEKYEYTEKSYALQYKKNFVKAKGMYIWDIEGKRYIDCLNGFGVNILGHNPDCLNSTLREYINIDPIWQSIDLFTPERIDFIETLYQLIPTELKNYKIAFSGPTGSESIEMAIKISRNTKKRFGIFAFQGCFHGSTIGANTLTGNKHNQNIGNIPYIYHMPFPREKKEDCPYSVGGEESINLCLKYIRHLLLDKKGGTDLPAAMIVEPCQSDGGIILTPQKFLQGLYKICQEFDILYISDEVQTGFGKTGTLFGYELANKDNLENKIFPDILVCSKSWGGGLPLSFCLYQKDLNSLPHTGTFRGNQIAFKLGTFFMKYFQENRILNNVKNIEKFWLNKYNDVINYDFVYDFRIVGSLLAIEFQTPEICQNIFDKFLEIGLLTKLGGRNNKTLIFWCMLNLNQEQLNEIYEVIIKSFKIFSSNK